ncbi:MAG: hypothetical protein GX025_06740 [Clostridiales bacterium]|nr:hypothetical protein [Clostridiales bacterium]
MNRNDEYINILSQLEDTPVKLDYTCDRALARYKEHKRRRIKQTFLVPLLVLVLICAVFTVLVNISPVFASAVDALPFIGKLAELVSYTPLPFP